jgi:hypothetical protein
MCGKTMMMIAFLLDNLCLPPHSGSDACVRAVRWMDTFFQSKIYYVLVKMIDWMADSPQ